MNWKLILQLSLFGLAMAIATLVWIPTSIEPFFWLAIFVVCAYFIARNCDGKYFLNGFMLSLINCVFVTTAHVVFFNTYIAHHAEEVAMLSKMPIPDSPRLMMLLTGPVIGIGSGLVQGLFAFVASKIIKRG
jgi:hypothetical protein